MDKKVIKRNGVKVNFDATKIFNAIYKATMASHDGFKDSDLNSTICQDIVDTVHSLRDKYCT